MIRVSSDGIVAENRHSRSRILRSKKGVGLSLILLPFQSYGLVCREERLWRAIAFKIRNHDISMISLIYQDIMLS